MKISILFILSCISLTVVGQEASDKKPKSLSHQDWGEAAHSSQLMIFQDSVKMPQNAYWDFPEPNDYKDIKVIKSEEDRFKATVYFTTKNPRTSKSFNFLNLKDIERSYTGSKKRRTLFVLNNQLIVKDLEDPKIDSSFIRSVEAINSGAITQLNDPVSEFTILTVNLNWKNYVGTPKHTAVADVPKFYFAPAEEKKEIKLTLPSEASKPKEVREFHFLSLKDIERKYAGTTSRSTLFFLDGELLTSNLSSYQIDSSYVYKVEVLPSTGIEYLKDNLPVFNIVKISLATPENTTLKIWIRGNETAMVK